MVKPDLADLVAPAQLVELEELPVQLVQAAWVVLVGRVASVGQAELAAQVALAVLAVETRSLFLGTKAWRSSMAVNS